MSAQTNPVQDRVTGRFLDGALTFIPPMGTPGAGYAIGLHDGHVYRNGEYVADATEISYDRDVLGWWVSYITWRGSALDHPATTGGRS